MASHFLDLFWVQRMGSHCYYFIIVLVLEYSSSSSSSSSSSNSSSSSSSSNYIWCTFPSSWANRVFSISVAINKLRIELELRRNNNRVCFILLFFLIVLIMIKYNFLKKYQLLILKFVSVWILIIEILIFNLLIFLLNSF